MLSGLVVGWRVNTGSEFLLAVLLLLSFAFAMAWIGVLLGLSSPPSRSCSSSRSS